MDNTFYAVVNERGAIFRARVDDDLCLATIFTSESDAYEFLIRFGDNNFRVVEVKVFQEKEGENA